MQPWKTPSWTRAAALDPCQGIHGFPKGARAGSFFHEIFEHLDFTRPDFEPMALALREYGFEEKWLPVVEQTLKNCLATSLHPDMPDLTLSAIPNADRVNEMEFYYPVKSFSPKDLADFFSQKDMGDLVANQLAPACLFTGRRVHERVHGPGVFATRAGIFWRITRPTTWDTRMMTMPRQTWTRSWPEPFTCCNIICIFWPWIATWP